MPVKQKRKLAGALAFCLGGESNSGHPPHQPAACPGFHVGKAAVISLLK